MAWQRSHTGSRELPVSLWLVRQMAQGLEALHRAGWIHGDIQPENVLVSPRGHVTLIDLGMASKIHAVAQNPFRGTRDYAAPESLSGPFAAIPGMDIFSLGRVLWQGLAHIRPVAQIHLEPVAELVEAMISIAPECRPSATEVVKTLLSLEIKTLGHHIGPIRGQQNPRQAA